MRPIRILEELHLKWTYHMKQVDPKGAVLNCNDTVVHWSESTWDEALFFLPAGNVACWWLSWIPLLQVPSTRGNALAMIPPSLKEHPTSNHWSMHRYKGPGLSINLTFLKYHLNFRVPYGSDWDLELQDKYNCLNLLPSLPLRCRFQEHPQKSTCTQFSDSVCFPQNPTMSNILIL